MQLPGQRKPKVSLADQKGCSAKEVGVQENAHGEVRYVHVGVMCFGQTDTVPQNKALREKPGQLCRGVCTPFTEQWGALIKPGLEKCKELTYRKPVDNKWPSHLAWRRKKHNPPGWAEL